MAEKLEDFNFSGTPKHTRYDWDLWLDGSIWRLTPGVDFTVTLRSMQSQAAMNAIKRGGLVRTSLRDNVLTLQFYTQEA